MYAALRVVLCLVLVPNFQLRVVNTTTSSKQDGNTTENIATESDVLMTTGSPFLSVTDSLESSTTISSDQIKYDITTSPTFSRETTTDYDVSITSKFEPDLLGKNEISSPKFESSKYEVRNIEI